MKCFYHPEVDAVGVCQNCGRGICRDCAVEVGNALACKATCAAVLQSTPGKSKIIDPQGKVVFNGRLFVFPMKYRFRTGLYLIMGALLIIVAMGDPADNGIIIVVGILFVLYGLYIFINGWRAARESPKR